MKKSNYISKYDYIGYYTKQRAFWFFTNAEIESGINTEIYKNKNIILDLEDDDSEDEYETCEFDSYEYYQEQKTSLKDIDKNNPKIAEGLIIDDKSKKYIYDLYKKEGIDKKVDFDDEEYCFKTNEERFEITKELILNNERIILFQPIFINKNLITKPDAIIVDEERIVVIETKGTTTTKRHHFLDLYFQSKVLESIEYLEDYYFEYELCVAKYCKANKFEIPFITSQNINYSKNVSIPNKAKTLNIIENKSLIKLGEGIIDWDEMISFPINITNLVHEDISDLEEKHEAVDNFASKKSIVNSIDLFCKTFREFDDVIKTLSEHQTKLKNSLKDICENIVPSENDKGDWKNNDFWNMLRNLYVIKGYELFKYSGNIVNQTKEDLSKITNSNFILEEWIKEKKSHHFINNREEIRIDNNLTNLYWEKLKSKKVYFDFETINTSIRPIDNCLPFMQIVTQCSIITNHNEYKKIDEKSKCINMIADPKNITLDFFKEIINNLFEGDEYSYIVYNKSFESSRLKEMAIFINEEEFSKKVAIIRDNLFDLADLFTIKKDGCAILIKELGGFYSIKKVLPYIEKTSPEIFKSTGCKDYSKLEVGNGLDCQNKTMIRFFDKMSDDNWNKLKIELEKYCENDIRAMVAVEYFIEKIINPN